MGRQLLFLRQVSFQTAQAAAKQMQSDQRFSAGGLGVETGDFKAVLHPLAAVFRADAGAPGAEGQPLGLLDRFFPSQPALL